MKPLWARVGPWGVALALSAGAAGAAVAAAGGSKAKLASPAPKKRAADLRAVVDDVDEAMRLSWKGAALRPVGPTTDAEYLRRATLDLVGRVPTLAELRAFDTAKGTPAERRAAVAATLVASPESADHRAWTLADLYADGATTRRGVDEDALHDFLAGALRAGRGYDGIVTDLLTAEGTTAEAGATNWLAMADDNPTVMAARTADQFLGLSMGCAQCHDHPEGKWTRETFWGFSSFFARTAFVADPTMKGPYRFHLVELPYGEVRMGMALPGSGTIVPPTFPDGTAGPSAPDARRRAALAAWVTAPANPWFAKQRVAQVTKLLLGAALPGAAADALASFYVASGFDEALLWRAVLATEVYGLSSRPGATGTVAAAVRSLTLRAVVRSIAVVTGAGAEGGGVPRGGGAGGGKGGGGKGTGGSGGKGTGGSGGKGGGGDGSGADRPDLMAALGAMSASMGGARRGEAPTALAPSASEPTLVRALLLMNGRLTDAATMPFPGSTLRALLDAGGDTGTAMDDVFRAVLARGPAPAERAAFVAHVDGAPSARAGWADVLWALFNSSEFLFNL
jgi:hypothetical protein